MRKRTTVYLDEHIHKAFKELCVRERVSMSEKVEKFIGRYVAVHMPGNPQLPLEPFMDAPQKRCFFCEGVYPHLKKVEYISGLIAGTCSECLKMQREKTTVKKILGVL